MIIRARRIVQILTLALLVLIPVLNMKGMSFISGSLYSFSIGPVWITDPLIGLQAVLTTIKMDQQLLLSMVIPVLVAFALGRVFCGWVCPQNTISEMADALAEKLGIKRVFAARTKARARYAVLAVLLLLVPLTSIPLAGFLSAPGIISVQTAQFVSHHAVGLELSLIGLIVASELFLMRRVWCNTICPVGSFLGLFRARRTLKVIFAEDGGRLCGKCLACVDSCPLGLDPMRAGLYPQCHNCGACVAVCREIKAEKSPLVFKF